MGQMFLHGSGDDEVDGGGVMMTENRGAGTLVDMGAEWGGCCTNLQETILGSGTSMSMSNGGQR